MDLDDLFYNWLKGIKWLLIIALPLMVIVSFALPIINLVKPWEVGESELGKRNTKGIAIWVGGGSSSSRSGSKHVTQKQRIYLLPSERLVVIITDMSENGESTISTETSETLFWIMPIVGALLIWISYRFCLPLIFPGLRKNAEQNVAGQSATRL